ncbi:hypothetical protein D039_0313A, partial [Vibrio parahaemolyticus EKP-028]
MNKNS